MLRFNDIADRVLEVNPGADLSLLQRAYVYSAKVHEGQERLSGEPYLIHPLEVAGILADLRLDEVTFIAKMTTVSVELLKAIAERREWTQRPEIALALVRNPKTPVPLAIQMLRNVAPAELRRLAKGGSLRMPILQAARKLVVG